MAYEQSAPRYDALGTVHKHGGPEADVKFPLFDMKTTSQPHRKARKLNFDWNVCGYFFQGPLYKCQKKKKKGPFFSISPP